MARFCVEPERAGARLDYFVAAVLPGLSAAAGRRLVESGAVRVDGRPAKKGDRLLAGQTVEIDDARGARESPEGDAHATASLAEARAAFLAMDSASRHGNWGQFGRAWQALRRALGADTAGRRP